MFAARYTNEFPALSPVAAMAFGDHRFDGRMDGISDAAQTKPRILPGVPEGTHTNGCQPGGEGYLGDLSRRVISDGGRITLQPHWNRSPVHAKMDVGWDSRASIRHAPPMRAANPMSKRLAIILAAGKGTRMKSDLPKVLCPVRGRPMIEFVLDALRQAGIERMIVVVGYRSELVRQALADHADVEYVEQTEQLGTGHAVKMCREHLLVHDGPVLIVTGDSPLTQSASVHALFADFESQPAACVLGTLHKTTRAV